MKSWRQNLCAQNPHQVKSEVSTLSLVALYRAIRLRFGYGFESCDPRTARETSKIKTRRNKGPLFPPLLPVGGQESVLKVPKRVPFHAAVRVTTNAIRVPKEHYGDGRYRGETFANTKSLSFDKEYPVFPWLKSA